MANNENMGAGLKVLVRAYHAFVSPGLEGLPQGPRGFQVLEQCVNSSPSQLEIAKCMGLDKTATTYLIDELVEQKLVVRQADKQDRRIRRISATVLGKKKFAEYQRTVLIAEEKLLTLLSTEEQQALRSAILKLQKHYSSVGQDPNCDI